MVKRWYIICINIDLLYYLYSYYVPFYYYYFRYNLFFEKENLTFWCGKKWRIFFLFLGGENVHHLWLTSELKVTTSNGGPVSSVSRSFWSGQCNLIWELREWKSCIYLASVLDPLAPLGEFLAPLVKIAYFYKPQFGLLM